MRSKSQRAPKRASANKTHQASTVAPAGGSAAAVSGKKPHSPWFKRNGLPGLVLISCTLAAYLPALRGTFVWDDAPWTTEISSLLKNISGLWTMWTDPMALQQYYPLTGTSFWLDYQFWGFRTLPYHVENVLLHGLAAVLFWRLLRRLEVPGAWLAAVLFALHPVMVQSAAWIAERKNVLSLVLYLGALLAYERFAPFRAGLKGGGANPQDPGRRRWPAYAWAGVLFVAAMLAKITACSLPAVVLLICWWKRGRIRWRQDVIWTLPLFAAAMGFGFLSAWLEKHHVMAQGPEFDFSFAERCLIAGRALWFYTGKLIWPAGLALVFPRWRLDVSSMGQWIWTASALAVLLALWMGSKRFGRGPATAVFFFVGTLFPVLGFLNVYYMVYSFAASHWVYLSSLGLIALAAALFTRLMERLGSQRTFFGIAAAALSLLAVLTWRQAGTYADYDTLFKATLAKNPGCSLVHDAMASRFLAQGQLPEAILHFGKSLEQRPLGTFAHNGLGVALIQTGRIDEGRLHFEKTLELEPQNPMAHYNLGNILLKAGEFDSAIEHYLKSLASELNAEAFGNLAEAYLRSGRANEAIQALNKSLDLDSANPRASCSLGNILLQQGQLDQAIFNFQKSLQAQPGSAEAHFGLGNAFFLNKQPEQAEAEYRECLKLQPDNAMAEGRLGNVRGMKGDLDEAVLHLERAVRLQPEYAEGHFNLGNIFVTQKRLKEAVQHYELGLRMEPNQVYPLVSLARLLATSPETSLRNGLRAVGLMERANQLSGGNNALVVSMLAAAYAEAGRCPEAATAGRRAAELAGADPAQANAIRAQVELYQAGRPLRDPTLTNALPAKNQP